MPPCYNHGQCLASGCQCYPAYRGPGCSVCADGYGSVQRDGIAVCERCDQSLLLPILLALVAFILIGAIAYKLNQNQFIRELTVPLRTSLVYLQTISFLISIGTAWPQESKVFKLSRTHRAVSNL